MTPAERLDLARKLTRASLDLLRDHQAHRAIDAAVAALMAPPVVSTNTPAARGIA